MTIVLRALAVGIAVAAIVDPAFQIRRSRPLPVDIRTAPSQADRDGERARSAKTELVARLGSAILESGGDAAAVVTIGGSSRLDNLREGVPVSTVSVAPRGPNVRIVYAAAPDPVILSQRVAVAVEVEAAGADGRTSIAILERDGIELARAEHTWAQGSGRARIELPFVPSTAGLHAVRVRLPTVQGEATGADNVADIAIRAIARPLRVLTYEPRPAWAVTFVRRALEQSSAFEVSAIARHSRGLETRTGSPPASWSATTLARFDALIVGAPEDLGPAEVDAIAAFVELRGGAAVFLPDRRPSGPYVRLLPAAQYEEVLLEKPATLGGPALDVLKASELILPRVLARNATALASIEWGGDRPVITSAARGAGLVLFSGALDAWRFRGGDEDAFAGFWRGLVAGAALGTPPPLSVTLEPALAAPHDMVRVRVAGHEGWAPAVTASIVAATGATTPVRLWPGPTPGTFVATLPAPSAAGNYDLRVASGDGRAADALLVVRSDARTARLEEPSSILPLATGGVAAHSGDLDPIERHLRSLDRPIQSAAIRPMRSPWWLVPFAAALCGEWTLRRRKGLR